MPMTRSWPLWASWYLVHCPNGLFPLDIGYIIQSCCGFPSRCSVHHTVNGSFTSWHIPQEKPASFCPTKFFPLGTPYCPIRVFLQHTVPQGSPPLGTPYCPTGVFPLGTPYCPTGAFPLGTPHCPTGVFLLVHHTVPLGFPSWYIIRST